MQSEKKSFKKPSAQSLLIALCGALVLALIVVSAFAYTWRKELKAVTRRAANLQAVVSSADSITEELNNLQMQNASLKAELEALQNAQAGN